MTALVVLFNFYNQLYFIHSMQNYVALLRGINVSGKNIIKMDQLKACCLGLGWQQVKTYIQSGNVVFQAAALSTTALAEQLEAAIQT